MINIRLATESDASAIVAMSHALAVHEGGPVSLLTEEAVLRDGFGDARIFTPYLAELDNAPVGYISLTLGYDFGDGCPFVWVAELYVDPACRRRGIARALMARAARHAVEMGAGHLQWSMVPNNPLARGLYDAMGANEDTARYLYLDEAAMRALAGLR